MYDLIRDAESFRDEFLNKTGIDASNVYLFSIKESVLEQDDNTKFVITVENTASGYNLSVVAFVDFTKINGSTAILKQEFDSLKIHAIGFVDYQTKLDFIALEVVANG